MKERIDQFGQAKPILNMFIDQFGQAGF